MEGIGSNSSSEYHFGIADWTVFVLMLVVSMLIGVVSAVKDRRRSNTQEFLLGGRDMPPFAVALSLLGGWISAISILGNPTEMYFYGTQLSTTLLGLIPAVIMMHQITIPIFYNLKMYSICEYLELRYKSTILRKFGTMIYLANLCVYMGMCLFAPSLALATVTNLSSSSSIIIMGVVVTFYITIGGVKAVVYTDVMQTLLMFGGVLAVTILCCIEIGGIEKAWEIAGKGGRLEFFNFDTDPYVRHTFWSTVTFGFFLGINAVATEQSIYQRLASVKTVGISQGLSWFFLGGLWCLWTVFFLSGIVAFAVYSTCDPLTSGKIEKPDQIIPFLVTDKMGHIPAISGMFVAAVYGGVLSSLSSSGNSIACLVWQDFLQPYPYFRKLRESSAMLIIKSLSALSGLIAVGLGLLFGNLGSIFHVINNLVSAIGGPLKGLFLAGILFPWVNAKGAFTGFLVSFSFSLWMVVSKFMKGGGKVPKLPLSVEGCPISSNFTTDIFTTVATTPMESTTLIPEQFDEDKSFYEISYCYSGIIVFLLTIAISSVVSLLTGPMYPEDLCEGVINPTCERLYVKLCRKLSYTKGPPKQQLPSSNQREYIKMYPQPDTNMYT